LRSGSNPKLQEAVIDFPEKTNDCVGMIFSAAHEAFSSALACVKNAA
jgi:hypothetical protein